MTTTLYRIIELEESDKETMHLLIFLLMQFLSRSDLVRDTNSTWDQKPLDQILFFRLFQLKRNLCQRHRLSF